MQGGWFILGLKRKVTALACLLWALFYCVSWADVKSTSGTLRFDSQGDGLAEAELSSTGLGIGGAATANLQVHGNALIATTLSVGTSASEMSTSTSSSNLHVQGSLGFSVQDLSLNANVIHSYVLSNTASGNLVAILPDPTLVPGQRVSIKQTSLLNHTLITSTNKRIDQVKGVLTLQGSSSTLLPYANFVSDGQAWRSLSQHGDVDSCSANLVGAWHFDETSGSSYSDYTGGGNDVTVLGYTLSDNSVISQVGRGIKFGGVRTSYGEFPTALKDLYLNNYSLSCWYRPDVVPSSSTTSSADYAHGLIVKPGHHIGLRYRYDQTFSMDDYDASDVLHTAQSAQTYAAGSFYHLVGVVDRSAGTAKIYVNGSLQGTATFAVAQAPKSNTNKWRLGVSLPFLDNYSYPANGVMDEVRMFNKALSAEEVQQLYLQYR